MSNYSINPQSPRDWGLASATQNYVAQWRPPGSKGIGRAGPKAARLRRRRRDRAGSVNQGMHLRCMESTKHRKGMYLPYGEMKKRRDPITTIGSANNHDFPRKVCDTDLAVGAVDPVFHKRLKVPVPDIEKEGRGSLFFSFLLIL